MYNRWGFVGTVFQGTDIKAHGKELGSKANPTAQNSKRKLSAIEDVENLKTARKMDMIFRGGDIGYGCLEISQKPDPTKELRDSRLKLPIVMKDQLLDIFHAAPELLHQIGILGYNINGPSIQLLELDAPKGYVTRIRRTRPLRYPSCPLDFTSRVSSLLQIATLGKTIVEESQDIYSKYTPPLQSSTSSIEHFPPCFTIDHPSASPSPSSKSTRSSSNSSNKKKQKAQ